MENQVSLVDTIHLVRDSQDPKKNKLILLYHNMINIINHKIALDVNVDVNIFQKISKYDFVAL